MRLLRTVVVNTLAIRQQLGLTIPSSYCSPTCPNCKLNLANFNVSTACVKNSSFITNCGACQQCILTYAIEENEVEELTPLEGVMEKVLDLCMNTTVSGDVSALQSQASRLSLVGDYMTSKLKEATTATISSRFSAVVSVSTPTITAVNASLVTAIPSMVETPTSLPDTEGGQSLNQSWVVGPVIGSILGVATVFIVIYFTRRRQRREDQTIIAENQNRDFKDSPIHHDRSSSQSAADSAPAKELETNEIYELPAVEPVGSELSTPKDGEMDPNAEWPLPITPLRAMFAMTEIRDERAGSSMARKHETYYHS